MENSKYIFLDIDGVLATTPQYYSKKRHEIHDCYRFDPKCVKIFKEILARIEVLTDVKTTIILSSDWKTHYDINAMNNIFEWNDIDWKISEFTENLWGTHFFDAKDLEECRAAEINMFVKKFAPLFEDAKWIAIDDLDLSPYIGDDNFVHTPRHMEGIKQSGIKDKIYKRLL